VQRLRQFGWIEGRTITMEDRWRKGRSERFAEIAAEFVRGAVMEVTIRFQSVPTNAVNVLSAQDLGVGGAPVQFR
jgi:hypothetical protein